jgi:hypothetical protein
MGLPMFFGAAAVSSHATIEKLKTESAKRQFKTQNWSCLALGGTSRALRKSGIRFDF